MLFSHLYEKIYLKSEGYYNKSEIVHFFLINKEFSDEGWEMTQWINICHTCVRL